MGIDIPSDGGAFTRLCAKMATGSGKTVVMAIVIAWHALNKVANPRDARFAKNVLVIGDRSAQTSLFTASRILKTSITSARSYPSNLGG